MDFKKKKLLSLSCYELQQWLTSRNISENVSKVLKGNSINGTLFLKLTRADLLDLFPDSFIQRKELWDLLVDQRQEEFDNMAVDGNNKDDADNSQDGDDDDQCESQYENLDDYLKNEIPTNSPVLVIFVDEDDNDREKQTFIVIDKTVFLECGHDISYSKALILLLACYYSFNLQYTSDQLLMFRFLEEYVLKVPIKRRTLKYKRMVNKLLSAN